MKLIIDRKTWIRGEGEKYSFMYRSADQHMCCLGFMADQCGLSKNRMSDVDSPCSVDIDPFILKTNFSLLLNNNNHFNSQLAEKLMAINDLELNNIHDANLANLPVLKSEEEREKMLIEQFAGHNIYVEFIN